MAEVKRTAYRIKNGHFQYLSPQHIEVSRFLLSHIKPFFRRVRRVIYHLELPRVAAGSQRKNLVLRLQAHLAFRQRIPT